MKKTKRKMITILMTAVLLFTVTGCSFSVGSTPEQEGQEKQEDLFPDAGKDRKSASYKAYDFSLEGLGNMTVYVDTTEGHDFELVTDNSGFNIVNKDGEAVLYAACLSYENYQSLTAEVHSVKTINGRTFLYRENGDGSIDVFCYMADCGLDGGLVMESHTEEDVFHLVAFRGTAVESSLARDLTRSSTWEEADTAEPDMAEPDAGQAITSSDTDYDKINWGVSYAPFENYPGFVVSVAPFIDYGDYILLIAFTNSYEDPVSFSGDATAYGENDSEVGSTFVYTGTICKGNTLIATINCGEDMPDGRIHWSDCSLNFDPVKEYAPWEADVNISGDPGDGYLTAEYSISCVENTDMIPGEIVMILVDEDGNVIAVESHYEDTLVAGGDTCNGSFSIYQEEALLKQTADYVMFASPEKSE